MALVTRREQHRNCRRASDAGAGKRKTPASASPFGGYFMILHTFSSTLHPLHSELCLVFWMHLAYESASTKSIRSFLSL